MEISAVISDIMGVLLLKDPGWQKNVYWEKRLGLPRGALFSAEEGLAKPDPRLYRLALSRLEVQPVEVIFIDDREENIQAAQQIGMHTILFEQNEQAIAALQSMLKI